LNELGFEPTSRFVEGEPTPTIAAVAKEIAADLVVVGHRSERFLSRWWSGSKQSYLTEYVKCSVLIARNALTDEEFEAEYRKLDAMGYGNEGAR
jgi:nucleotide-binding universal stress UspA family protein